MPTDASPIPDPVLPQALPFVAGAFPLAAPPAGCYFNPSCWCSGDGCQGNQVREVRPAPAEAGGAALKPARGFAHWTPTKGEPLAQEPG
jgi:hypothetical protein